MTKTDPMRLLRGLAILCVCAVALCACSDIEDRQQAAKESLTASARDGNAANDLATRAAKAAGGTPVANNPTPKVATPTVRILPTVGRGSVPGAPPFTCPDPKMTTNGAGDVGGSAIGFLNALYSGRPDAARPYLTARLQSTNDLFALIGTRQKYDSLASSQAIATDTKTGCASIVLNSTVFQSFNLMFYIQKDDKGVFKVDYINRL